MTRTTRVFALVLAIGAVATASELTGPPAAAVAGTATSDLATNNGNPNAVPPILPPASASDLAELRLTEAWTAKRFHYHLPATARYSMAEMNAYAGGSG